MTPSNDPMVVFLAVASRYFTRLFTPNTCIEQSRVAVEVLNRLGYEATAYATRLTVRCKALKFAFVSGYDATKLAKIAAQTGNQILHQPATDGSRGLDGHVGVAASRGDEHYFIDFTLAQASNPPEGPIIDREPVCIPLPVAPYVDLAIEAVFESGEHTLDVQWVLRDDPAFRATEAWEPSHLWPLINRILKDAREELR